MIPAYYLMIACTIGLVIFACFVKETAGKSLRGSLPAVEDPSEIDEILKKPKEALWWKEELMQI